MAQEKEEEEEGQEGGEERRVVSEVDVGMQVVRVEGDTEVVCQTGVIQETEDESVFVTLGLLHLIIIYT